MDSGTGHRIIVLAEYKFIFIFIARFSPKLITISERAIVKKLQ